MQGQELKMAAVAHSQGLTGLKTDEMQKQKNRKNQKPKTKKRIKDVKI